MKTVEKGDKVKIIMKGKLENGQNFFKKDNKNSLIVIGKDEIFPALEKVLIGMKTGETKTVTLKPEDAYGEYNEEFLMNIPKNRIDPDADLSVGNILVVSLADGKKLKGIIIQDCSDDVINVDFNHPLAGKKLIITCTIDSIEKENT